ncbi:MAG TPA: hypothetical protein VHS59_03280, partial [Bacillota bacterium]|nr:hypothetical protein [Bacillota bacterium]
PVGGLPILWHIMKYYSAWNHKQFVLCLGYKGQSIKNFFLDYEAHTKDFTINLGGKKPIIYHNDHGEADWEVTLAETGLDAMTGARVKRVKKYLAGEENFMLTYGDGLSDIDLDKLIAFHNAHGKILTVSGVRPPREIWRTKLWRRRPGNRIQRKAPGQWGQNFRRLLCLPQRIV